MKTQKSFLRLSIFAGTLFPLLAVSCAPVYRPTLEETRSGRASTVASDVTARPGETRAEVEQVDPVRGKVRLRLDSGRTAVLDYDAATRVVYHERDYDVRSLEAGDVVVVRIPRNGDYLSYITVQETVQDRIARGTLERPANRPNTIEGIVDNINPEKGVLDLRAGSGRIVTVTLPYDARSVDVENFRRLRRGDVVRLEGEFVAPGTFQFYAFRTP
ncbi:MAG: hypothetical protein ACREQW_09645 [Candidatus Binatia bacterium]